MDKPLNIGFDTNSQETLEKGDGFLPPIKLTARDRNRMQETEQDVSQRYKEDTSGVHLNSYNLGLNVEQPPSQRPMLQPETKFLESATYKDNNLSNFSRSPSGKSGRNRHGRRFNKRKSTIIMKDPRFLMSQIPNAPGPQDSERSSPQKNRLQQLGSLKHKASRAHEDDIIQRAY